jgi:hypothetical protein
MKNVKLAVSLLILASTSFFTSCTPENLDYISTTKEIISKGQWSVDYYYSGQDKTTQYSNYQFSFLANGSLVGAGSASSFTGTWSMERDVNRNDVIRITINSQEPHLMELNEQWNVTDKANDAVTMKEGNDELRIRKL